MKDYQVKVNSKSKQVEQLQQLKQTLSRQVDSLQAQLPQLAASLEAARKKIDLLKKENSAQHKTETGAKDPSSKLSYQLVTATNQADSLRKKFDLRLNALDKALILSQDLDDKINALIKENNR